MIEREKTYVQNVFQSMSDQGLWSNKYIDQRGRGTNKKKPGRRERLVFPVLFLVPIRFSLLYPERQFIKFLLKAGSANNIDS